MRVAWVARSFLDYRVPVYRELHNCLTGQFVLFYNADYVPDRCRGKIEQTLGRAARGFHGELAFACGSRNGFANKGMRIPYQPGLVKAVMDEHPDVLVSDGFFQWTYASMWLRAIKHIPHVMCYERTAYTERHAQWFRTAYRKLAMRWIDAVCCNGSLCGEYMQGLGFPADRITYGHMVADVVGMQQAASSVSQAQITDVKAQFDLKGLVLLYVGQLIPRKGIDRLLEAWRLFSSQTSSGRMTLLLVGDGPQRGDLKQYCATHGLDNVRFAGAVDYDALAPFYRAADIFIIPTIEDNWSLVVPEAMACGLPILCSRYNGCWPELVHPDVNGWVFDPVNSEDCVEKLRLCIHSQSRLGQMGRRSREIVEQFNPENAAKSIFRACEIAIAREPTLSTRRSGR